MIAHWVGAENVFELFADDNDYHFQRYSNTVGHDFPCKRDDNNYLSVLR